MNVVDHIRQNFELYGFASKEGGIWQIIRELVENAKDAIHKLVASEVNIGSIQTSDLCIKIIMKNEHYEPNGVQIEIFDNGLGMDDPLKCITCFSSLRASNLLCMSVEEKQDYSSISMCTNDLPSLVGKYGIGLSACVLYSQLESHRSTRIITRTLDRRDTVVADFEFDLETGKPVIIQSKSVLSKPWVGTKM